MHRLIASGMLAMGLVATQPGCDTVSPAVARTGPSKPVEQSKGLTGARTEAWTAGLSPSVAAHWQDGKAELAGYALRYPRYGQLRKGTAVTIFVTEDQLPGPRVKPEAPAKEAFPVIKLNLVQDFQTGIYDYNLMTSVFASTRTALGRPAGSVSKVSFSAQEWCGHVYAQALFDTTRVRITSHSYFEGEADTHGDLPYPNGGLPEEALWLWARGLAGPVVKPGASLDGVPLLSSLAHARLLHRQVTWGRATLSRAAKPSRVATTAGDIQVRTARAVVTRERDKPRNWSFEVEETPPHRLIRVTRDDGFRMELLGSKRMAYWQLQRPTDRALLSELGLAPPDHNP